MKYALGCLVVVVVVVIAIAGWGVSSYNNFVRLSQAVDQQWGQVQTVYQRRADLIGNLVNTVSGAANFEKSTLVDVTKARASASSVQMPQAPTDPAKLAEFEKAQGAMSSALSRLLVTVERYPELKANQNFLQLQAQLEGTENRIAVERARFNEVAGSYNIAVRSFPSNLIAGLGGFQVRPYFSSREGADVPPTVKFDFNSTPATPAPAK